jgi:hypothetical protein
MLVNPPTAAAVEAQVVPLEVKTLPDVPAAMPVTALVPAPTSNELAVRVAAPVPPLATARVPATVTTPDDADEGVRPVVPKPIVVTPLLARVCQVAAVPLVAVSI